jgi:3-oxoacyl-[acyl-carrier protein] reductase
MTESQPVAIVTGAAQGIGRAVADRFVRDGFAVAIVDLNAAKAEQVADELCGSGAQSVAYGVDVTDSPAVNDAVKSLVGRFGRIDVLVNNAGTHVPGDVLDTDDATYDKIVDSIMKGTFWCSRAVLPTMIEQHRGAIVNVSSVWAWACAAGAAPYCMAKAGIVAFTKSLAAEVGQHGIRVNAVGPYLVATELHRASLSDEARRQMSAEVPLGRESDPDEIAAAIAFLASDEASWVSGDTLTLSGGALLR